MSKHVNYAEISMSPGFVAHVRHLVGCPDGTLISSLQELQTELQDQVPVWKDGKWPEGYMPNEAEYKRGLELSYLAGYLAGPAACCDIQFDQERLAEKQKRTRPRRRRNS